MLVVRWSVFVVMASVLTVSCGSDAPLRAVDLRASIVLVEADGCPRPGRATGFAVDEATVVTAAHTLAGAESVWVSDMDGNRTKAEITVFDGDLDAAVIHAPGVRADGAVFARAEAGDQGELWGFGGDDDELRAVAYRIERRVRANTTDIYGERDVTRRALELTAPIRAGDSGAPVLTAEGAVSGMVFAVSREDRSRSWAITAEEIESLLARPRAELDAPPRCVSG